MSGFFVLFFESSPAWPGTFHVDQASLELVTILQLLPTAGVAGLSPYPALVGSLSKPLSSWMQVIVYSSLSELVVRLQVEDVCTAVS